MTFTPDEMKVIAERCGWTKVHLIETEDYVDRELEPMINDASLTLAGERICIEVFELQILQAPGTKPYVGNTGFAVGYSRASLSEAIAAAVKEAIG